MVWRVLQLLLTIEQAPGMSAKALAERCEISERSVYRYAELLRLAGVPIYADGGYKLSGQTPLSAVRLTLSESLALVIAGEHLSGGKAPFSAALSQALRKILAVVPEELRVSAGSAKGRVLMDAPGPVDYSGSARLFAAIDTAVRDHEKVAIMYRSLSSARESRRVIDPYGTVFRHGLWYVAAFCHRRNEERLFRLDRVISLERTGQSFEPRTDFSLADYMRDAWHVERGKPITAKVRFSGLAKQIVMEGQWHPSQKVLQEDSDTAILSFKTGGLRELSTWLMGFGGEAEVLEPPELRELLVEKAVAVAAVHGRDVT